MYTVSFALPGITGDDAEVGASDGQDCSSVLSVRVEGLLSRLLRYRRDHAWHTVVKSTKEEAERGKSVRVAGEVVIREKARLRVEKGRVMDTLKVASHPWEYVILMRPFLANLQSRCYSELLPV